MRIRPSARAALAIADRIRRQRLVDRNNWKWGLESISLLPADSKHNKWCWSIKFTAEVVQGGMTGGEPEFQVFILMDGQIIEPKSKDGNWLRDNGIIRGGSGSGAVL